MQQLIKRERPRKVWKDKPRLKVMRTTQTYRVRAEVLEAYLRKVLGMSYSVLKAMGLSAGECPEFNVAAILPEAKNRRQLIGDIRDGRRTRNLGLILNVLCLDGFIPAGNYVIDTHTPPPPLTVYRQLLQDTMDPTDPKCASFRVKHWSDKVFRKGASVLDKALTEYLEDVRHA